MMNKNLLCLSIASALLLGGCGSDSDNSLPTPEVQPPVESTQPANAWGPADRPFKLVDPITVFIDVQPTMQDWVDLSERNAPRDGFQGLRIHPDDIRKVRPKPLRSDVLQDGQISYADVMLYLSDTLDNFHVEYEWSEEIGGYRWTVWHDPDQPVKDEQGNLLPEFEDQGNPHWYASFLLPQGEMRTDPGFYDNTGETFYRRLETNMVAHDSGIYLRPFSPGMTHRREQRLAQEVAIMRDNEHYQSLCEAEKARRNVDVCVVIPEVEVTPYDKDAPVVPSGGALEARGYRTTYKDVVVTPHNLRPDIYKEDSFITLADVYLSMHEQGLISVEYSYWGTLDTGVKIDHYYLTEVDGSRTGGGIGYIVDANEREFYKDFGPKYGLTMVTGRAAGPQNTMPSFCDGIDTEGHNASYGAAYMGGPIDGVMDAACIEYFEQAGLDPVNDVDVIEWSGKGAYHIFSDVWALEYGNSWVELRNANMYGMMTPSKSKRYADDGKYPIHDTDQARFTLTEEHFGWGVADCGQCHSLNGIHANDDVGTLGFNPHPVNIYDMDQGVRAYDEDHPEYGQPKAIAPYQCAECHGSNGAPQAHGEIGRCFWCHSKDFQPKNHGVLNTKHRVKDLWSGRIFGNMSYNHPNPDLKFDTGAGNPAHEIYHIVNDGSLENDEALRDYARDWIPMRDEDYLLGDKIMPTNDERPYVRFFGAFQDDLETYPNSDYSMSPIYPDPYSCMTCHKSPE